MQKMFRSATLKLTGWYLLILMMTSIIFSAVIYQINFREVSFRLENLQHSLLGDQFDDIRMQGPSPSGPGSPLSVQSSQAANQMVLSLIYLNVILLAAGGLGCYFLARRTLRPIEAVHEAQSRFTSDASHELRTPLAAMKAELEVALRDDHIRPAEARELMESNLEEVDKLIDLSEVLLKLSRLEQDKLEWTSIDLVSVLEQVIAATGKEKKRFTLTSRKKAEVSGNEPAVRELFTILVDNALKYSPPKSPIQIRLYQRLADYGIEFKNQAVRIPDDALDKIFNRFYRVDTSRTASSRNGYGLGLSIAKKITDVHHGEITVKSGPETTAFTVFLPFLRKSPARLQA